VPSSTPAFAPGMPVSLDPPALPDWEAAFKAVQHEAQKLDVNAVVVGGYVRDRLLAGERAVRIPEVDIVVVDLRWEKGHGATELARAVGRALSLSSPPVIFERFGTAHLTIDPDHALEFVSSRAEKYGPTSRKPHVYPASLDDDVRRRDFTINTLLMDWDGTVLDLTGRGIDDLKARRIVTPVDPDTTFDEDPLRMLRAVRFATTLQFTLDSATEAAIRKHAARLQPPTVSMERIRDEFSKLLLAEQVQGGLELLDTTRLLPRILPQLEAGKDMQQGGWHSHDVFGHALLAASLAPAELITRLAALLHDVGKPAVHELRDGKPTFIGHQEIGATMAGAALRHLRYPGDMVDAVTTLVRLHMRPIQYDPHAWEDKAVRRLIRDAGDQLDRLLALARADMRASHYPDVKKIDDLEARIRRLDAQAIAAIRSPLTGEELMARYGRPPGPWIKRVKSALEEAIVDGALASDAQAAWRYLEAHPELLEE
jgi:poly(A) polymerase